MGCAARDRNVVFASTLASFFTRAYDQLRTAAISESNINLCGSHCGLSTGQSAAVSQNSEHAPSHRPHWPAPSPLPPSFFSPCSPVNLLWWLWSSLSLIMMCFPHNSPFDLTASCQSSPFLPTHLCALDGVSRGPCVPLLAQVVHCLPGLAACAWRSACVGSPDLRLEFN